MKTNPQRARAARDAGSPGAGNRSVSIARTRSARPVADGGCVPDPACPGAWTSGADTAGMYHHSRSAQEPFGATGETDEFVAIIARLLQSRPLLRLVPAQWGRGSPGC